MKLLRLVIRSLLPVVVIWCCLAGPTGHATALPVTSPTASGAAPYLPFDASTAPTAKVVIAHYVPWFPVSLDDLPADRDYYAKQYLNPLGEKGIHAAYGGLLRNRPLPRAPIGGADWQVKDAVTEVRQALSAGIDGFAVDVVAPDAQDSRIGNLYLAANDVGNFSIQPVADMTGPLGASTSREFAADFAPHLAAAGTQRLPDGRPVLGAFYAEARPATWWRDTVSTLRDEYHLDVAFVPTFLDAEDNMDAFAPFSYGFGNWGGRNPASTDPRDSSAGSQAGMIEKAHSLGKIWTQPVAFQDSRPREGVYEESGNTSTNANGWNLAIQDDAEWVQLVTWNDYAEGTAMAPSANDGFGILDQQAYFIEHFKHGAAPTITRDALFVSARTQFADARSTYDETLPMRVRPDTPPPTDVVHVVAYATAPATVWANVGGVISSREVGAGRTVCDFPLQPGRIVVGMSRAGGPDQTVDDPHQVTTTPYVQDLEYRLVGGLR